jgi:predicted N-formylglutamate amidohydrolase
MMFVFLFLHECDDLPYLEDHWGWDVGAADLTRHCDSAALLTRYSRLVCDPNRAPEEPSFVVREVAGHALSWNRAVDAAERQRRRARYFDPYHTAVDAALAQRTASGARCGCARSSSPYLRDVSRATRRSGRALVCRGTWRLPGIALVC